MTFALLGVAAVLAILAFGLLRAARDASGSDGGRHDGGGGWFLFGDWGGSGDGGGWFGDGGGGGGGGDGGGGGGGGDGGGGGGS